MPDLRNNLRPFQQAGVDYAVRQQRVLIGDEMGLGKTVEALATLEKLNAYPALVVCPAHLKGTWRSEAEAWLPAIDIEVLGGRTPHPIRVADITIANYDILPSWESTLSVILWKALVCDESHMLKNPRAQRTRIMTYLSSSIPTRLLLTGTPVVNRPAEL